MVLDLPVYYVGRGAVDVVWKEEMITRRIDCSASQPTSRLILSHAPRIWDGIVTIKRGSTSILFRFNRP